MGANAVISRRGRKIRLFLGIVLLLPAFCSLTVGNLWAGSQNQIDQQAASGSIVIQGRITAIEGTLVTVKLPNGYPGGKGGHAQFVTAGPVFRVDISHARVLLPDGKQTDKQPLVIGDRVLMVLSGPASAEPGNVSSTYSASIVERVVQDDKIITH